MNKKKTYFQRLETLVEILRDANKQKIMRETFHMDSFVNTRFVAAELSQQAAELRATDDNFCGTPACALGHYAAREDKQKIFKIATNPEYEWGSAVRDKKVFSYAWVQSRASNADIYPGSPAVKTHFGLTDAECNELFGCTGCNNAKTPLQAANYIQRFINRQRTPSDSKTA